MSSSWYNYIKFMGINRDTNSGYPNIPQPEIGDDETDIMARTEQGIVYLNVDDISTVAVDVCRIMVPTGGEANEVTELAIPVTVIVTKTQNAIFSFTPIDDIMDGIDAVVKEI